MQVIAAAMIGLGSYMVYVAHVEGSPTAILAIGYLFIISGIVLLLLVVFGVIAAVFASKIVLAQVCKYYCTMVVTF